MAQYKKKKAPRRSMAPDNAFEFLAYTKAIKKALGIDETNIEAEPKTPSLNVVGLDLPRTPGSTTVILSKEAQEIDDKLERNKRGPGKSRYSWWAEHAV